MTRLNCAQATVIYPAALAVAQEVGATGEEFIAACVVGYEVGCRVGEYLGKSHYEVCFIRRKPPQLFIRLVLILFSVFIPQQRGVSLELQRPLPIF